MQSAEGPTPRPAARIILIDGADRILLFRFVNPTSGRSWWITPGGGLDPGETHRAAARRELREETGLTEVRLSRCVWRREHEFTWLGRHLLQQERFFVARVATWTVDYREHTEEELIVIAEHRWWSIDEIRASSDLFAPRLLADHLAPILAGELPKRPVRLE